VSVVQALLLLLCSALLLLLLLLLAVATQKGKESKAAGSERPHQSIEQVR
jgi:hypothetical protein